MEEPNHPHRCLGTDFGLVPGADMHCVVSPGVILGSRCSCTAPGTVTPSGRRSAAVGHRHPLGVSPGFSSTQHLSPPPLLLDLRSSPDFPQTPRIAPSHSIAPNFQQAEGLLVQHLPSVTQGLPLAASGGPAGQPQGRTDLGDLKTPCLGTAVSVSEQDPTADPQHPHASQRLGWGRGHPQHLDLPQPRSGAFPLVQYKKKKHFYFFPPFNYQTDANQGRGSP